MKRKNYGIGFMVFFLITTLCICPVGAASKTRGVTDNSVLVGSYQTLSGPVAILSLVGKGADAYFKMINDRGGIHGRKIKFIMEDDQYNVGRAVAATKKFVERDQVFALVAGMNTGAALATMKYCAQKKVPIISGMASSKLVFPPNKYVFTVRPASSIEGRIMAKYAVKKLNTKRIGIFYLDGTYGLDALQGVMSEFDKQGIKPVVKTSFNTEDVEYSNQLLKLKEANPDTVICLSAFRNTGRLLMEADKIGFKPTWFGLTTNNTPTLLKLSGPKAAEGIIMPASLQSVRSGTPQMLEYLKNFKKYYPKENVYNSLPQVGWSSAMVFSEALKRAGKDLTMDKFIQAMESIKGWDKSLSHKITYGPDRRDGQRALRMCQVKNGKIVQIDDFVEISKLD